MKRALWHRFVPHLREKPIYSPVAPRTQPALAQAMVLAGTLLKEYGTFDAALEALRRQAVTKTATKLLASLLLQSPRAVRAQVEMDGHKRNFHDRHARLFELIDFNDTFVAAVLALPAQERVNFVEQLHESLARFSHQHRAPQFNDRQYDAIVHGLSREIAVYLAASQARFDVLMSSRTDDAFGVDMQLRDPQSGDYVNIDCKTHSSFYFRVKELVRERRLTLEQATIADELGYCPILNHHNGIVAHIVLVRIDHTLLGEIVDFEFVSSLKMIDLLRDVLNRYPLHDDGFGRMIAPLDF